MKFNNSFIKKKKLPSFLFCSKKNLKFFEMFKWKKIISKNFRIPKKIKNFVCAITVIKLKKHKLLYFQFS